MIQTVWDWDMTQFYSDRWGGSSQQWTEQGNREFRIVIGMCNHRSDVYMVHTVNRYLPSLISLYLLALNFDVTCRFHAPTDRFRSSSKHT